MKYLIIPALVILLVACVHSKTGSGNIISKTRSTGSFISISAAGPVNVKVENGPQTSVTVETDDNIMPFVETIVTGSTLKVRLKDINSLRNSTVNVYVTLPAVKGFSSSASAEIISKDVITSNEKIELKASSGSKINIQTDAPSVDAEASSGADLKVSGRTKDIMASASSGSNVNAASLKAENANANASSGASVKVFASISIRAEASSGGTVKYAGGAQVVKKNESSGGTVKGE